MPTSAKDPRVLIAIPSGDMVHAEFLLSLVDLLTFSLTTDLPEGMGRLYLDVFNVRGSILPKSRDLCVQKAITGEFSHILFLDSDMTFPKTLLHRWLYINHEIMAANCVVRRIPTAPTARNYVPATEHHPPLHHAITTTRAKSEAGLVEAVDAVGTAVMLLQVEPIKQIPRPRFMMDWNSEIDDYVGEDIAFLRKMQALGHKAYIDHMLSIDVGHVGQFIHTHALVSNQSIVEAMQLQKREEQFSKEVRDEKRKHKNGQGRKGKRR